MRTSHGTASRFRPVLTTVVLLTGMVIALAAILFDFDRTPTIIAAQAVTVVGAPLIAAVLLWLTSRKDVMGEHKSGPATLGFAAIGLVLLIVMAGKTAFVDMPEKYNQWKERIEQQ